MTGHDPSLPVLGRNGDAAIEVRRLWSSAARVDIAIGEPDRLRHLLGPVDVIGPRAVRLISGGAPRLRPPPNWNWSWLAGGPTPEFILFYRSGRDFPHSALIFSGPATEAWWTWHRRPLVLQRLRERFRHLLAHSRPPPIIDSQSEAGFVSATRGAGGSAGSWQIREVRDTPVREASNAPEPEVTAPTELYRRVLRRHFADGPAEGPDGRPDRAPALAVHQQRAYERALSIIERFGGVIVADAVGLGKTYVGLRLLERTLASGGRGLVIVPAALREQWRRELAYLAPALGDSEAASMHGREDRANLDLWLNESSPVEVVSMESLGRGNFDRRAYRGAGLIIVDEAHHFRNPATNRYRTLLDISRHSQLALLTATPINNRLRDLQHLIDLFAAPGAFRHLGLADYRDTFRAAAEGQGDVAAVVSACVVRRTRRSLRAAYGPIQLPDARPDTKGCLHFPRRLPPRPVVYDLQSTYGGLLTRLEAWFDDLTFPTVLLDADSDDDPAATADAAPLLKLILLKRLESSIEAFRNSVVQQLAWCSTALRAIEAGRLLTRPDYRAGFRGASDDPGGQLALFELMLPTPRIDPQAIRDFRHRLEDDRELLQRVHASIAAVGAGADRKLARLIELLDGPLAGRKTLLFTEFRDTARYLHRQVRDRPHVAEIDSGGARLGLERASRREVIERFAPLSNGLPEPHVRERVDLLIATDVLSEGLNLQDASTVVSYDLPWNPVRLMQRMGRIDRLGAVSDIVELHHFVPAEELDRLLGLMERLRSKLGSIESAIGLDEQVLAGRVAVEDEVDRIRRLAVDPEEYKRLEADLESPLDAEEQAYLDFVEMKDAGRAPSGPAPLIAAIAVEEGLIRTLRCGHRTTESHDRAEFQGGRVKAAAYWRLNAGLESRGLWILCEPETGYVVEDQAGTLRLMRLARGLPNHQIADRMVDVARRCCARYARSVAARLRASRIAGDALRPALPQYRIAAWLSRYFESAAERLGTHQRQILDALLDGLAQRFPLATERKLRGLAEELPERATWGLVEKLAADLSPLIEGHDGPIVLEEVALLLITPKA